MRGPKRNTLASAVAVVIAALLASSCASDAAIPVNQVDEIRIAPSPQTTAVEAATASDAGPVVNVLSSDADRITGDDALVQIERARIGSTMTLNGDDITGVFDRDTTNGNFVGLVHGLGIGSNSFGVTSGSITTAVTLTTFPRRGPVFSGPQSEPLACTTEQHGLGPPLDADCTAPTKVFWTYITRDNTIKPLPGSAERPNDIDQVSVNDTLVDAIIRNEVGTINRGVYWLHSIDPSPELALGDNWDSSAWNKRLIFRYGGGCTSSYSQGNANLLGYPPELGGPVDIGLLRQGDALGASTFTSFATHCNDVLSAETTMMVKEHFVERYEKPELTIGQGGSAGAIQQFLIAQNYPGLLDGITASAVFPDWVTTEPGIIDCALLTDFYQTPVGQGFSPAQRAAVNGHATAQTCQTWNDDFRSLVDPTVGCDESFTDIVFHPADNPNGLRCTVRDAFPLVFGTSRSEPVPSVFDNVGVQYGLGALNDGTITVDQFLDLNEFVGSFDRDGTRQAIRAEADVTIVEAHYRNGRVNHAEGDVRRIPIVVTSAYRDAQGDIHDRWRVFSLIDRIGGGGTEPPSNVALFSIDGQSVIAPDGTVIENTGFLDATADAAQLAVLAADEWATAVAADTSGDSRRIVLETTRPDSAADRCVAIDGTTSIGPTVNEFGGPCAFPILGDPRQVAGSSIAADVLKCARNAPEPLSADDYLIEFTIEQTSRLNVIFPNGTCDYTRPGLGQSRLGEPWREYGDAG